MGERILLNLHKFFLYHFGFENASTGNFEIPLTSFFPFLSFLSFFLSFSLGAQPGRPGSYRFFMRGHNVKPQDADFVVKMSRKPKLRPYVSELKKKKRGGERERDVAFMQCFIL